MSTMTDYAAAASAACAAKSAGWEALRRSNADLEPRAVAHAQMLEADVSAEEFRAAYHPMASRAFGVGDRFIGQPFEMYVVTDGEPTCVWRESR